MYKLVLIRHGESTWNLENRFTGWTDVDLTPTGVSQAMSAGQLLKAEGYEFDMAYTSVLKRAIQCLGKVRGRIRSSQVHGQPTSSQLDGNRCGQSRFPDTTFAHHHDQAMIIGGDLVDQGLESWSVQFNRRTGRRLRAVSRALKQKLSQGIQSH